MLMVTGTSAVSARAGGSAAASTPHHARATVATRFRRVVITAHPLLGGKRRNASKVHGDTLPLELYLFGLRVAAYDFNREDPCPARPLLHPLLRFYGQAAGRIVPAEADPNGFRVRVVAVAEALPVIAIER